MLDEGLLHRVQLIAVGEAFDGGQFGAVAHHRQGQAGVYAFAVAQYRTGAALAVVTAFFAANQVQLLAQQVQQRGPGQYLELAVLTIEGQAYGVGDERLDRRAIRGRAHKHLTGWCTSAAFRKVAVSGVRLPRVLSVQGD